MCCLTERSAPQRSSRDARGTLASLADCRGRVSGAAAPTATVAYSGRGHRGGLLKGRWKCKRFVLVPVEHIKSDGSSGWGMPKRGRVAPWLGDAALLGVTAVFGGWLGTALLSLPVVDRNDNLLYPIPVLNLFITLRKNFGSSEMSSP